MNLKSDFDRAIVLNNEKRFDEAYYIFKYLAESNYLDSYFYLGKYYLYGLGIKINYDLAFKYFSMASIEKVSDAYFYLAMCYIKGYGVAINKTQGELWLKNAINENKYFAYYELGKLYLNTDDDLALKYFKLGAQNDNLKCIMQIVKMSEDHSVKKDYLVKAINLGNVKAVYELGLLYMDEGNKAFALFLLEHAAKNHIYYANYVIGKHLMYGDKLFYDPENAVKHLILASQNNVIEANIYLGDCFYFGLGVSKDLNKAKRYYELAANNNNLKAIKKLAEFYFDSKNSLYDPYIGKYYTEKAASLGDVPSMRNLGYFYLNKIGILEVNLDKAYYWFNEAANLDDKISKKEILRFKKTILGRLKYD